MTDIIPEAALDYLPFSPEPLSQWNDQTDLLRFLYALHDKRGVMIAPDGTHTPICYRDYGEEVYRRGNETFKIWLQRFAAAADDAVPAPAAAAQSKEVPDLAQDPAFGNAAKYVVAWDGVVGEVLSESAFFSISHILESEADLDCSLHLAANLYYKQALQVLRNFLEDLVLPIHFCDNPDEYLKWKSNAYQVPPLRGRDGVLRRLVKGQILPPQIADAVSNLYGDLNGCIHGSERRLVHKGVYAGAWMGQVFKHDDLLEWCRYLCGCVDLGIRLARISVVQWEGAAVPGKVLCSICHNDTDFDTETSEFAGEGRTHYRCRRCGNEMTFAAQRA